MLEQLILLILENTFEEHKKNPSKDQTKLFTLKKKSIKDKKFYKFTGIKTTLEGDTCV